MYILGFVLSNANVDPIFELLEYMEGERAGLGNHSHRISMNWGSSRISKRRFSKSPALVVQQKAQSLNPTSNTSHKEKESCLERIHGMIKLSSPCHEEE